MTTIDDDAVDRLAALAGTAAREPLAPELDAEARLALIARMNEERAKAPRSRALPVIALAAALVLGIGALVARSWPQPLEYQVSGASTSGPYVSADAERPAVVVFTDGSRLEAAPGARFRVEEPKSNGARVLLERGRTSVAIVHRDNSSWSFGAGPFDVKVTGTRFDIAWDPQREKVELVLAEGSVEVRGPFTDVPIAVRAGQRFHADLASRTMTVVDGERGATAANPVAPATSSGRSLEPEAELAPAVDAAPATQAPPAVPSSASSAAGTRDSWAKLVAGGKFESVIQQAMERGTAAVIGGGSAADLRALADAARYTGRSDLSVDALMALRTRFSGTKEERSAAFLLGRVEEARGNAARAGGWYERYLTERPNGELAAEALAGRMRTVSATSGRRAAQPLAREYLSRYADGVHAEAARAILQP